MTGLGFRRFLAHRRRSAAPFLAVSLAAGRPLSGCLALSWFSYMKATRPLAECSIE